MPVKDDWLDFDFSLNRIDSDSLEDLLSKRESMGSLRD